MVGNHHELGKCWQAEQKVVWTVQIGHFEPERLSAEILLGAKDHIQPDATKRSARQAWHNAMKRSPIGLQIALTDAQLDHSLTVQDVNGAAAIDEGPSEQA